MEGEKISAKRTKAKMNFSDDKNDRRTSNSENEFLVFTGTFHSFHEVIPLWCRHQDVDERVRRVVVVAVT